MEGNSGGGGEGGGGDVELLCKTLQLEWRHQEREGAVDWRRRNGEKEKVRLTGEEGMEKEKEKVGCGGLEKKRMEEENEKVCCGGLVKKRMEEDKVRWRVDWRRRNGEGDDMWTIGEDGGGGVRWWCERSEIGEENMAVEFGLGEVWCGTVVPPNQQVNPPLLSGGAKAGITLEVSVAPTEIMNN
ncbi:hypothetical protein ACFE04_026639 [Oxalis oulophora]